MTYVAKKISKPAWISKVPKKPKVNLENIPFIKFVYTAFVINVVTIIFVLIIKSHLPPQVPLFYGLARGEEQLANNTGLLIPNLISSAILIINIAIAYILENDFLRKTLIVSGFLGVILATITTLKIIILVGSF